MLSLRPYKRQCTITGARETLPREIRVFVAMLEFSDTLNSASRRLRRIPVCRSKENPELST